MLTDRTFIHTKVFDKQWFALGCDDDDLLIRKLEEQQMSQIGKELIEAMKELVDNSEGKIDLRTSKLVISPVCETMSAEEIKATRKSLGMSQGVFAIVLGVSKKTVESWEIGRYTPDGAARRLISLMQIDPTLPEKYGIVNK